VPATPKLSIVLLPESRNVIASSRFSIAGLRPSSDVSFTDARIRVSRIAFIRFFVSDSVALIPSTTRCIDVTRCWNADATSGVDPGIAASRMETTSNFCSRPEFAYDSVDRFASETVYVPGAASPERLPIVLSSSFGSSHAVCSANCRFHATR